MADPQFARSYVLQAFNHAEVYLFLGSTITTVGLLAGALSVLRRRFDALLLWFALFAFLYGARLQMNHQLFWALGLHPTGFQRFSSAIGYLIPIPAFFFFRRLNLLGKTTQVLAYAITPIVLSLSVLTLLFGPLRLFWILNNTVVTLSLLVVIVTLMRLGPGSSDIRLIRGGLAVFVFGALFNNVSDFFQLDFNLEPFCFLALLAALGLVAARRGLANQQQLALIQKELEIARNIQLSILPAAFPPSPSFSVTARYLPMTSVAGDFYDFLLTGEHEAGLLIADVSGHGVPAAMIASMVKLAANSERRHAASPAVLLAGMNAALLGNTQNQFVTAAYVHLNAASGQLVYAAAGHPPMLLLRDGDVSEIVSNGLILAAFAFATYDALSLALLPGDRLLLYTDGILEATDTHDEEFGPTRLTQLLRDTAHLPDPEVADRILSAVRDWSAAQGDDLTVIVCDVKRAA